MDLEILEIERMEWEDIEGSRVEQGEWRIKTD